MIGQKFARSVPTVAVFAREPVAGRAKTRLARTLGAAAALELYGALLTDLAKTLRAIPDLRVVWWVDGQKEGLIPYIGEGWEFRAQPPGDLGHRLGGAFEAHFSENSAAVAVIGTDCPGLDATAIAELFSKLGGGNFASVIPALDGGFCALALERSLPGLFEKIRWSCSDTLCDLKANLADAGLGLVELPPLSDVDEASDLPPAVAESDGGFSRLARSYGVADAPQTAVVDDLGRVVPLTPLPRRIVSLVPSVTETLLDWELGERVVGRTDYCISPKPLVDRLPCLGGPKTLDVASILGLAPDLVFADAEENSREEVEALMKAGVRVFVALPRTLADVASFLHRAAQLTGVPPPDQRWLDDFASPPEAENRTVCLIWLDPIMAATSETLPGALMEAAGFACALKTGSGHRYPALTEGELAALAPRYLLLPSEPFPFDESHATRLREICPDAQGLLFPGEWVTWYSARTPVNLAALRSLPRLRDLG